MGSNSRSSGEYDTVVMYYILEVQFCFDIICDLSVIIAVDCCGREQ